MNNGRYDVDMIFENRKLATVVTLREACRMWDKSPRQIMWAIDKDYVVSRKSITGGSWLITYDSLVKHFGEPEKSITQWMV